MEGQQCLYQKWRFQASAQLELGAKEHPEPEKSHDQTMLFCGRRSLLAAPHSVGRDNTRLGPAQSAQDWPRGPQLAFLRPLRSERALSRTSDHCLRDASKGDISPLVRPAVRTGLSPAFRVSLRSVHVRFDCEASRRHWCRHGWVMRRESCRAVFETVTVLERVRCPKRRALVRARRRTGRCTSFSPAEAAPWKAYLAALKAS